MLGKRQKYEIVVRSVGWTTPIRSNQIQVSSVMWDEPVFGYLGRDTSSAYEGRNRSVDPFALQNSMIKPKVRINVIESFGRT
jgi:hypothetical protein